MSYACCQLILMEQEDDGTKSLNVYIGFVMLTGSVGWSIHSWVLVASIDVNKIYYSFYV